MFSNEAKERGVKLRAEIDEDYEFTGLQATALREALSNLILNALQACERDNEVIVQARLEKEDSVEAYKITHNFELFNREENGQDHQVASNSKISSLTQPAKSLDKRRLSLSVTDTGRGISVEEQLRVFEPFYTTKSRGTGLGLAIVQRRATEFGGSVELTSPVENHHGTRFRLAIPLTIDEP